MYETTKKYLQELNATYSQLFTRPVINPLHCPASNTVDSQGLLINYYVSKYHTTVVTTELSAYLDTTFQLS